MNPSLAGLVASRLLARVSPATQVEEMSIECHKQRSSALRPVLTFVPLVSFCGQHYSFSCCLRINGLLAAKRHKIHKKNFDVVNR